MYIEARKVYKKVCLNCRGNWDRCLGIECQCFDGACCIEFNSKDMENKSFWYELVKEE